LADSRADLPSSSRTFRVTASSGRSGTEPRVSGTARRSCRRLLRRPPRLRRGTACWTTGPTRTVPVGFVVVADYGAWAPG